MNLLLCQTVSWGQPSNNQKNFMFASGFLLFVSRSPFDILDVTTDDRGIVRLFKSVHSLRISFVTFSANHIGLNVVET
jgi:hypothetical protein